MRIVHWEMSGAGFSVKAVEGLSQSIVILTSDATNTVAKHIHQNGRIFVQGGLIFGGRT